MNEQIGIKGTRPWSYHTNVKKAAHQSEYDIDTLLYKLNIRTEKKINELKIIYRALMANEQVTNSYLCKLLGGNTYTSHVDGCISTICLFVPIWEDREGGLLVYGVLDKSKKIKEFEEEL